MASALGVQPETLWNRVCRATGIAPWRSGRAESAARGRGWVSPHPFDCCADPAQLQKHAEHFATDVEFYHDTGGVTWTRDAMIANTAKYACGHYTRELVAGSLQVSPVKDFGAIEHGVHRFCQVGTDRCEGEADFTIVWRLRDGQWTITRVLSYGHRPSPATP